MKLNAIPVFGFETQGCLDPERRIKRNLIKGLGAIPIINIITGIALIAIGTDYLQNGYCLCKEDVDYPKLKGAVFIIRGVLTLVGGGILFLLVDIVTTIGRAALQKESAEVPQ